MNIDPAPTHCRANGSVAVLDCKWVKEAIYRVASSTDEVTASNAYGIVSAVKNLVVL